MSSALDIQYKKPTDFGGAAYLGLLEQGLHLEGTGAGKKFTYLLDSIFAFTDAPIRLLLACGIAGIGLATIFGTIVLVTRLVGLVVVPGYAGTMLAVLFFGGLNALGLGLVGNYAWRAYENTKQRPLSIPMLIEEFPLPPCPESLRDASNT